MTNIQTRQLTDKDMHDFRHIRLSALKNNPEMFASTYDIEAKKPLDVFLKVVLDYVVFGTYHQNNIIGMLIFHQEEDLNGIAHAHLYGFFIEPAWRGQGIATQLLQTVLAYAQPRVKKIRLSVVATNTPAIHLYQKQGFQIDRSTQYNTSQQNHDISMIFLY